MIVSLIIISCQFDEYELEKNYSNAEWESIYPYLNLPAEVDRFSWREDPEIPSLKDRTITLGRVLFYDKDLSVDGTVACASCHKQEFAFSDNVTLSIGVHGNLTSRNSFPIGSFFDVSSTYGTGDDSQNLFWDLRADNMIEQLTETFANPNEMGTTPEEIAKNVESKPYYQTLFKLAGLNPNSDNVKIALRAFINTFNSKESKFDQARFYNNNNGNYGEFMSITDTLNFTLIEDKGKKLFNTHCNSCHHVDLRPGSFFRGTGIANNGLNNVYKDKGMGSLHNYEDYNGVFVIPQLRNVAQTAPYMHDGRFATLSDVIDFYSKGIQNHRNLNRGLKDENGKAKRFNFTNEEKNELLSFLNTLTDHNLLTNTSWSDPFKK